MRITATQVSLLKEIVAGGGVVCAPSPSASGSHKKLLDLESLGLLANRDQVVWEVTEKGLRVSKFALDAQPTDSPVDEDGCIVVQGQRIAPGDEILIKGKRGKFKFKCANVTAAGRVVINTIGPVGMHQAFRNFYIEDVKLLPVPKPKRRRRRVV